MILLTTEQRNRLKAVSSGVYGDLRENLTEKQAEETAKKIDEVLYELHLENPDAFNTFAYKNAKGRVIFSKLKTYEW